jgi:conjugative transfer region protein (TIGR03750 family)
MRASCKHLTHKHAPFYGCTFGETALIALIYFLLDFAIALIASIFAGFSFGVFIGVFIVLFLLLWFLVRATARRVGRMKEGKQQGYIELTIKQYLAEELSLPLPFIIRAGKWSARRSL